MNNYVYGKKKKKKRKSKKKKKKKKENVRNQRDIKLITSNKRRKRLVSKPNYHSHKIF